MEAQASQYGFRGAVLVAHRGRVLSREGYGIAGPDGAPVSPETRFPLASVTKPITAVAVATLVSRGAIAFTDPVCRYLRSCPSSWRPIRISDLLNHTSGIPALPPGNIAGLDLEGAVELLAKRPLEFSAGSDYAYSNSNYWVVGRIVEVTTGSEWGSYLEDAILAPLGMRETGLDSDVRYDATGFTLSLNAEGIPTSVDEGFALRAGHATLSEDPAGGLVSTIDDLHSFLRALDSGDLISRSSRRQMWTPKGAGRYADYGLGWEVFEQNGTRVVQHDGAMPGFATCLSLYPSEDLEVVVLSNIQETIACEYLARDLGAIVLGTPYRLPRAPGDVTVSPEMLTRYVGAYEATGDFGDERVTIALEDGSLVMHGLASVGPPFIQETVLKPFTSTLFFNPQDPHVRISFEHNRSSRWAMHVHRPAYKRLPPMREHFRQLPR